MLRFVLYFGLAAPSNDEQRRNTKRVVERGQRIHHVTESGVLTHGHRFPPGEKRSELTPNAPTVAEAGVPSYEVRSWNALFAKTGTPPDIVTRLNQAVNDVVALPDIKKRMLELGLEAHAGSPEEIAARLKADIAEWTRVIDDAHIPKMGAAGP